MALPAGRKGVLPSELTPEGKIRIPQPASELPEYSSSDAGKVLGVDSDGDLEFVSPPSGMTLYTKEFSPGTYDYVEVGGGWYNYYCNNVGINGYTPVFVTAIDVYTGYYATPGGISKSGNNYNATAFIKKATDPNCIKFIVYYVKNENIEVLV